jgi:hypothetical protein
MPRTSSNHLPRPSGDGAPRQNPPADRLSNIETSLALVQRTLDVQFKRIAAIQAQLDHLMAKNLNT